MASPAASFARPFALSFNSPTGLLHLRCDLHVAQRSNHRTTSCVPYFRTEKNGRHRSAAPAFCPYKRVGYIPVCPPASPAPPAPAPPASAPSGSMPVESSVGVPAAPAAPGAAGSPVIGSVVIAPVSVPASMAPVSIVPVSMVVSAIAPVSSVIAVSSGLPPHAARARVVPRRATVRILRIVVVPLGFTEPEPVFVGSPYFPDRARGRYGTLVNAAISPWFRRQNLDHANSWDFREDARVHGS